MQIVGQHGLHICTAMLHALHVMHAEVMRCEIQRSYLLGNRAVCSHEAAPQSLLLLLMIAQHSASLSAASLQRCPVCRR